MNNIEILEEKIKIIESLCTDDCINKSTVIQPLKYAIENLIQENKELKEKNKILESLLQGNLFEMYKYYKELCNSYQGNSVSKDKIKARIEKLKVLAEKSDDETLNACELDIRKNQIYLLYSLLIEGE